MDKKRYLKYIRRASEACTHDDKELKKDICDSAPQTQSNAVCCVAASQNDSSGKHAVNEEYNEKCPINIGDSGGHETAGDELKDLFLDSMGYIADELVIDYAVRADYIDKHNESDGRKRHSIISYKSIAAAVIVIVMTVIGVFPAFFDRDAVGNDKQHYNDGTLHYYTSRESAIELLGDDYLFSHMPEWNFVEVCLTTTDEGKPEDRASWRSLNYLWKNTESMLFLELYFPAGCTYSEQRSVLGAYGSEIYNTDIKGVSVEYCLFGAAAPYNSSYEHSVTAEFSVDGMKYFFEYSVNASSEAALGEAIKWLGCLLEGSPD